MIAVEEKQTSARVCCCPACGAAHPRFVGRIASRYTGHGFTDGGELFECSSCSLLYLEKPASSAELTEKYEELPADLLPEIAGRYDFDFALRLIESAPGAPTVLDVGCFRGDFLQLLPDRVAKFGIEPGREARQIMEQRGIKSLGETIASASAPEGTFDFITMMDVAEHLPNPLGAIQKLSRWLKPGGKLIITTGDSDALPWRLSRLSYWYYLPQHLSFCNRRWFAWAADKSGLRVESTKNFSHSRRAYGKLFVAERWQQFLKVLCGNLSEQLTGKRVFAHAVGTATWPDHLFVVLQR